jgi:hypothetical protein
MVYALLLLLVERCPFFLPAFPPWYVMDIYIYMLLQAEDAALPDFISFLALKLFPRFKM